MTRLIILSIFLFGLSAPADAYTYDRYECFPKGKAYESKAKLYYAFYSKEKSERLTFVYSRDSKGEPIFRGFWISKTFAKRLPLLVLKYIGTHITSTRLTETKSIDDALSATKKAIDVALDQRWKNNLTKYGQEMVNNPRYHRGNSIIDNNSYYEFLPSHLGAPDSTKKEYIQKPLSFIPGFSSGSIRDNLDAITKLLDTHGEHHNNKIVSDWSWRYNGTLKKWEIKSDTTEYHLKEQDTCKLKMELRKVHKGELMPSMCWRQINGASWRDAPTYCNFFAQTLACLTFEKSNYSHQTSPSVNVGWYPWQSEKTANGIYDFMMSHPELFVDLQWKNCWDYINAGYPVYFISNNPNGPGHIATGYPSDQLSTVTIDGETRTVGQVVQAGVKDFTKIFQLTSEKPWTSNQLKGVRTFIFLGYIKL